MQAVNKPSCWVVLLETAPEDIRLHAIRTHHGGKMLLQVCVVLSNVGHIQQYGIAEVTCGIHHVGKVSSRTVGSFG